MLTFSIKLAISILVSLVPPVFRGKKLRFRAHLILVEMIFLLVLGSSFTSILLESMSVTCFIDPSVLYPLWYSSMIGLKNLENTL